MWPEVYWLQARPIDRSLSGKTRSRPSSMDAYCLAGTARGMRQYLESETLQTLVSEFFAADKPIGRTVRPSSAGNIPILIP
jgi:hypothetical protein